MTQVIRLEQGECTQCPEGNCELINGVVYEKAALDDKGVGAVRYLHAAYSKFRLAHRPLDKVADPQAELVLPQLENTILKPEIAVTVNGMEFPQWVVEFADDTTQATEKDTTKATEPKKNSSSKSPATGASSAVMAGAIAAAGAGIAVLAATKKKEND